MVDAAPAENSRVAHATGSACYDRTPAMHEDDPQFTNTLPSSGVGVASERRATAGTPPDAPRGTEAQRGADGGTTPDDPSTRPLEPGDAIGRYRVRERIGEGGMGVVYAAEDPELGRVVAIKLLRAVHGREAEGQQRRMLREAQALARVSHRNLVMVFDVGSLRGRVWIAMEYVAGDTLETWLGRERRTWSEIVEVFAAAGRGLAAVHAAGLVHRDFKPGNVIVRDDGTVQVLDFGLATQVGEVDPEPTPESLTTSGSSRARAAPDLDALAANLTTTGAFMGTPAYMAPEQFMMLPTDGRTDQFSLCVALYEALYGHRPFKGRDLAQLMAATLQGLPGTPPELPGVPLAVRQVIGRGLARAPDDRFPDMHALVGALVQTRTPTAPAGGGWRRFALGALAGGGALAIVAAVWLSQQDDDAPAPEIAPPPPTPPQPIAPAVRAPPASNDAPTPAPIEAAVPGSTDLADGPTRPAPTTGVRPASTDARGLPQAERPKVEAPPASAALPSLSDLEERDEPSPAEPTPNEPEIAPLDPPTAPGAPPAP